MKKGDNFFLVQGAEGSEKYNKFDRKRELLYYIAQRKETMSQGPIGRIITVQIIDEWEIEQVALLVPKVEDKEPKPGFRGNDGRTSCLDVRCLGNDPHYTDECPHKDEDINIPCEDKHCTLNGPHTVYNCHKIPRCHNPNCKGEQGTHWTKDCPDWVHSNYPNNDNGVHEPKDCPYQPMSRLCDICNPKPE